MKFEKHNSTKDANLEDYGRLVIDKSVNKSAPAKQKEKEMIDLDLEQSNLKKYQIDLEFHMKKVELYENKIKETKARINKAKKQ